MPLTVRENFSTSEKLALEAGVLLNIPIIT
jgi:hypothetical protein